MIVIDYNTWNKVGIQESTLIENTMWRNRGTRMFLFTIEREATNVDRITELENNN
jgi:hypothetical protein